MKVFAFSDLHGDKILFNKMKEYMDNCGDEYTCFVIGDVCDRGEDGYELMKTILNLADEGNFIYLMGNHEDMFVSSCLEYINECQQEGYSPFEMAKAINFDISMMPCGESVYAYIQNGGTPTITAWMKDGCPFNILGKLRQLSVAEVLQLIKPDGTEITYDICHSGCNSFEFDHCDNNIFRLLWNREHFLSGCKYRKKQDNHILLHGHTPVQYLRKYLTYEDLINVNKKRVMPIKYAHNTKIDLDVGTYDTKVIFLYDIGEDTFIPFYNL